MTDIEGFTRGEVALDYITSFQEAGIPAAELLKIMTVNAATLLGLKDRGTIKAGNYADLIACTGNPMEDSNALRHINFVMKNGKVIRDKAKE